MGRRLRWLVAAGPAINEVTVTLGTGAFAMKVRHDFDLSGMRSKEAHPLLHKKAYYTVNEIPKR